MLKIDVGNIWGLYFENRFELFTICFTNEFIEVTLFNFYINIEWSSK